MTDRIFGVAFILLGSLGYLCIADDLRHLGEIVGVSAVFMAGVLLTASGFHWIAVRRSVARGMAAGLLLGIGFGAIMDDMVNGVALGLACGAVAGLFVARMQRPSDAAPPGGPPA